MAVEPTLADVLESLGWSWATADGRRNVVTTNTGEVLCLTAGECWALLHERGLHLNPSYREPEHLCSGLASICSCGHRWDYYSESRNRHTGLVERHYTSAALVAKYRAIYGEPAASHFVAVDP